MSSLLNIPIQGLLTYLLFFPRRLRKGFLFLQNKENSRIGLVLSNIILAFTILLTQDTYADFIKGLYILGIIGGFLGIMLWWRYSLTRKYCENLKKRDRDNKLIPAMGHSVMRFMTLRADTENFQEQGNSILEQLNSVMEERIKIILKDQKEHKILPLTNIGLVDSTLQYFSQKASENDIIFDVTITCDVKSMAETMITPNQLQTLLADHIENSLIAVKECAYKRILVIFGIIDDCYEIQILDSGIPF